MDSLREKKEQLRREAVRILKLCEFCCALFALTSRAVEADTRGDYAGAIKHYESSIAFLITLEQRLLRSSLPTHSPAVGGSPQELTQIRQKRIEYDSRILILKEAVSIQDFPSAPTGVPTRSASTPSSGPRGSEVSNLAINSAVLAMIAPNGPALVTGAQMAYDASVKGLNH